MMPLQHPLPILLFATTLLLLLHLWLHHRQPLPYMDELFHVPQARSFCAALSRRTLPDYNPSITTLPGLYLPPALLHFVAPSLFPCTPRLLRLFSALSSLLSLPLLASLLTLLRRRISPPPAPAPAPAPWPAALALWLHPVSLFYALLYYTDPPAALYLLLTWHAALRSSHPLAALAGLAATCTRQTSMVWHAFVAIDSALDIALIRLAKRRPAFLARTARHVCAQLWPHALAGSLYVAFLVINGGPAVGDKAHHAPTAHWAMLPYFLGFHAASYLPFQLVCPGELVAQVRLLARSRALQTFASALCAALAAMVLATGDRVHPFVLADNRHYVFYVYRRWLLRTGWRRLVLVPVYAWGALGPWLELPMKGKEGVAKREEAVKREELEAKLLVERVRDGLLLLCAAATLVPSPLLEPRYFVLASTIMSMRRLARRQIEVPAWRLFVISMLSVAVNVALVYVFAEMPFQRPIDQHMPDDISPGRFMF